MRDVLKVSRSLISFRFELYICVIFFPFFFSMLFYSPYFLHLIVLCFRILASVLNDRVKN